MVHQSRRYAVRTWCLSREPRGVDKNSRRYLRVEQRERLYERRIVRYKEWTEWTAGTLGKSARAAKSPAVAHLHECSPPRTSSGGRWPPRHHVARESDVSPSASKHLTCLIWSNHPAVNLPRAVRLSSPTSRFLPPPLLPDVLCHSLEISLAYRRIAYTCLFICA